MRSFLPKLLVFLGLQATIAIALVVVARSAPDPFIGVLADKHAHLAASPQPRLLLVGGSNVAFGFQSEILAEALPYAPTNLALHAGLGLDYILADTLPDVRRHDLVLLCLEYRLLQDHPPSRELWEALLLRPRAVLGMKWSRLADAGFGFAAHLCDRSLNVIVGRNGASRSSVYTRASFNQFGDIAAHRALAPVRPYTDGDPKDILELGCAATDLLPTLQTFVTACEARGAQVVIFFPCLSEQLFADHRFELEPYVKRAKTLFGDRVLGRLEDIARPENEFFDTCYHLTGIGGVHHTAQVTARLQQALHLAAKSSARQPTTANGETAPPDRPSETRVGL